MRILLVTNIFPNPFQPTKGVFNLDLARSLQSEHEVRAICPVSWVDERVGQWRGHPHLSPDRRATVSGIEVHYPRFVYPPKVFRGQYGWFLWQSVRRTVRRLLDSYTPDVVLGYWAHPDGEVAVRTARLAGAAAAVLVGGSDVLLIANDRGRRRRILNVFHSADVVITIGHHLREQILGLGISPAKVHSWHRGVDTTLFFPGDRASARQRLGLPPDKRMLLWVGRMVPVKGLDVLLRACARLRTDGQAFRLYLVGDGALRPELEFQAATLGLSDCVSFAGPRGHTDLPDWYRAADLTVISSWSEGVPNVLRESLACGTSFVATNVGSVSEVATGSDQLVPAGNDAALARAIAQHLAKPPAPPGPDAVPRSWTVAAAALAARLGSYQRTPTRTDDQAETASPLSESPRHENDEHHPAVHPERHVGNVAAAVIPDAGSEVPIGLPHF